MTSAERDALLTAATRENAMEYLVKATPNGRLLDLSADDRD
jgi:hypothetical protein